MRVLSLLLLLAAVVGAGCVTSTPQSRIDKNYGRYAEYPEEVRRKIREGRVDVGFTAEMAEMALGKPGRKISRRDEANEDTEVWIYFQNKPRVSLGMAVGSGGYSGVSTGVSMSSSPRPDQETMRVILRDGHVTEIETVKR
jgi:hypothetical protein